MPTSKSPTSRSVVPLVIGLLSISTLAAQDTCDVQELIVGAGEAPPGHLVDVPLTGGVSCEVTGFSAAVGHDPELLRFVTASPGSFLVDHAGADLAFQVNPRNEDGYAVVGALFDLSFPLTVPPTPIERDTILAVLTYEILPAAIPGTSIPLLNRSQRFGDPIPISNIYSRPPGGVPIEPTLVDGEILVAQPVTPVRFRRGDVNVDGHFDLSDPIVLLFHLFLGEPPTLQCQKSADVDDAGIVDISSAILALQYLFLGTGSPGPPFAECGVDPTEDGLVCESFEPVCP